MPVTYVPTRSGMTYVCFIVDAFSRRIVGWASSGAAGVGGGTAGDERGVTKRES